MILVILGVLGVLGFCFVGCLILGKRHIDRKQTARRTLQTGPPGNPNRNSVQPAVVSDPATQHGQPQIVYVYQQPGGPQYSAAQPEYTVAQPQYTVAQPQYGVAQPQYIVAPNQTVLTQGTPAVTTNNFATSPVKYATNAD